MTVTYVPVVPALAGAAPNLVAVSVADKWQNNGHQLLHVHNGAGAPITVTIDDPNSGSPSHAQAFNPDVQITVNAGTDAYLGPFPPNRFNDGSGFVNVAYSSATTVTAEVIDAS